MCVKTTADGPECGGTFGIQATQKDPCYSSIRRVALATDRCPDQAQGLDPCLQNHSRNGPRLSEGHT
ncbi:MAG: hypothetical protein GY820_21980 [Gammaproteobacteria bacterium]|nr:hypothetical protein [Gammaproteobacteria bacterium]